jgi:hypothetical protein
VKQKLNQWIGTTMQRTRKFRYQVGPVPVSVTVQLRIAGGIDFYAAVVFDESVDNQTGIGMEVGIGPTLSSSLTVSAGIDLVVAGGGIRGNLDLINADLIPVVSPMVIIADNDNQSCIDRVSVVFPIKVPLNLSLLNGNVELYVWYDFLFDSGEASVELFSWNGLNFEEVLYENTETFQLSNLAPITCTGPERSRRYYVNSCSGDQCDKTYSYLVRDDPDLPIFASDRPMQDHASDLFEEGKDRLSTHRAIYQPDTDCTYVYYNSYTARPVSHRPEKRDYMLVSLLNSDNERMPLDTRPLSYFNGWNTSWNPASRTWKTYEPGYLCSDIATTLNDQNLLSDPLWGMIYLVIEFFSDDVDYMLSFFTYDNKVEIANMIRYRKPAIYNALRYSSPFSSTFNWAYTRYRDWRTALLATLLTHNNDAKLIGPDGWTEACTTPDTRYGCVGYCQQSFLINTSIRPGQTERDKVIFEQIFNSDNRVGWYYVNFDRSTQCR